MQKPDVIMSRMDYVIISQVVKLLQPAILTDEELSFLLGKPNNYVFSFIMDPSDKRRFTEAQLDILPFLLNCTYSDLIPNDTPSGEIQLFDTNRIESKKETTFVHSIDDATNRIRITWKKEKLKSGSFRRNNELLISSLQTWIKAGYFNKGRNGLEICTALKHSCKFTFSVSDLEKSLKVLSGKRRQLLDKKIVHGMINYFAT